jgi:hypothetical protein
VLLKLIPYGKEEDKIHIEKSAENEAGDIYKRLLEDD